MLDIDLIHEEPTLKTEFLVSLAADVLAAMGLVLDAGTIEGLDQWVYSTHSALSDTMRADMTVSLILWTKSATFSRWIVDLPRSSPVHQDFGAYVAWLSSLGSEDYRLLLDESHATLETRCEGTFDETGTGQALEDLSEVERVRACYGDMLEAAQIERLLQLYHSPLDFKSQLISVVTRFWEQFHQAEFEHDLPLLRRSVAYHRDQVYTGDLASTFTAVTGRRFPKDNEQFEDADRILFVPSCHIGPYVMVRPCDVANKTLIIHYNARPTGTGDARKVLTVQSLFPPLKALADETRLQILSMLDGRELYAQEIVDRLDISQSAVSRHLALMVSGGLLDVRREESMKYYSINKGMLAALAEGLGGFRGPQN